MVYTGIVGLGLVGCPHIGKVTEFNDLIQDLISSVIISVIASLFVRFNPQLHLNHVIVCAIMVLVPGAAITNAIRDTLHGDYAAGNAKILESFVRAAMIALGVYVGFLIMGGVVR